MQRKSLDLLKVKQALATISPTLVGSEERNAYYAQKIRAVEVKLEKTSVTRDKMSSVEFAGYAISVAGLATAYFSGSQSLPLLLSSGGIAVGASIATNMVMRYEENKEKLNDKLIELRNLKDSGRDPEIQEQHGGAFKKMVEGVKDAILQHDQKASDMNMVLQTAIKNNNKAVITHVIESDINSDNNPAFVDYLNRKTNDADSSASALISTLQKYSESFENISNTRTVNTAFDRQPIINQNHTSINVEKFTALYESFKQDGIAGYHVYPHDGKTILTYVPAYNGEVRGADGKEYKVDDRAHEYFDAARHPQHVIDVIKDLTLLVREYIASELGIHHSEPQNTNHKALPYENKILLLELSTTRSAAFMDTGREAELIRILKETSEVLKTSKSLNAVDQKSLFDLNGNAVGKIKIVDALPNTSAASVRLAINLDSNTNFDGAKANQNIATSLDYAVIQIEDGRKSFDLRDRSRNVVGAMVWAAEPDLDYAKTSQKRDHDAQSMEL